MGFSKPTVTALVRHLTGWTLGTIDQLFRDAGVPLGAAPDQEQDGSQRRSLARDYLSSLDLTIPEHESRLLAVFSEVLHTDARTPAGYADCEDLISRLRRDGFVVDPATLAVTSTARRHELAPAGLASLTDPSAIREHLARLDATVDSDPRTAVSVAKDLVESTAKLVLRERGVAYGKDDLPVLAANAQRSLGLHPTQIEANKGGDETKTLRTLLGSLSQLSQGLAELRNAGGVGHGRESVPAWVQPRHARLAATAAKAWCDFLLETLADPAAPWTRTTTSPAASPE